MLFSTKVHEQDGSLSTLIPAKAARRMGLTPGTELFWVEDGQGGYRVHPGGDRTRAALEANEEAITEYRDVFRELAN